MKTRLAVMVLLALAVSVRAADYDFTNVTFAKSGSGGSISIDVKEVASAKSVGRNWETDYGSYDRDFFRTKTVGIDITRFNDKPVNYTTVEVIWFAQKLATKSPFVYSHQQEPVIFDGGQKLFRITFTMPELKSNVTNYEALGEQWVSGSKVLGWVVYVRDASTGQVLRHKASSLTVDQLTKSSISDMLSEYKAELAKR